MSWWSISAMSPRTRCLTSSFVRRPERTGPLTVRASIRRSGGTIGRVTGESAPLDIGTEGLGRVEAIAPRVTRAGLGRSRGKRRNACSGRPAQVARVASRGGVLGVGAEHPHELGDHVALGQLHDGRPRRAPRPCP